MLICGYNTKGGIVMDRNERINVLRDEIKKLSLEKLEILSIAIKSCEVVQELSNIKNCETGV